MSINHYGIPMGLIGVVILLLIVTAFNPGEYIKLNNELLRRLPREMNQFGRASEADIARICTVVAGLLIVVEIGLTLGIIFF